MNHKFSLTIPVSTMTGAPLEVIGHLPSGTLVSGSCSFPAGCEGLVGLRVLRGLFQIWPINTDQWLVGDDHTFEIPFNHPLRSGESQVRIQGYNSDTANEHTISVQFNVEAIEDNSKKFLGIVSAELPKSVREDITELAKLCKQSFEIAQIMGESVVPMLAAILDRLEPDVGARLRSMSLEELSRL